jgi:hypothetical protein
MAGLNVYLLGALSLGAVSSLWGSSLAIGTATAKGAFVVNKTKVSGSAQLFDGSSVETGAAASRLQLNNGSLVNLNANSSVTVSGTEAVLVKGSGEFGAAAGFNLQARTLRVETEGSGAKAEVRLSGDREVLVKALNGSTRVFSKTGVLVALVNPGMGVALDPYAAPADDFDMGGCLLKQSSGSLYGLAVDNVLYEVTGPNLAPNVGNRVHIVGTRSASPGMLKGAASTVAVTRIEVTAPGGCRAAAGLFAAPQFDTMTATGGVVPPPVAAGGHHTAIIAGVAVAAVAGGVGIYEATKSK